MPAIEKSTSKVASNVKSIPILSKGQLFLSEKYFLNYVPNKWLNEKGFSALFLLRKLWKLYVYEKLSIVGQRKTGPHLYLVHLIQTTNVNLEFCNEFLFIYFVSKYWQDKSFKWKRHTLQRLKLGKFKFGIRKIGCSMTWTRYLTS